MMRAPPVVCSLVANADVEAAAAAAAVSSVNVEEPQTIWGLNNDNLKVEATILVGTERRRQRHQRTPIIINVTRTMVAPGRY